MNTREQEIKAMLSSEEYELLKHRLDFDKAISQINFYYTDKDGIIDKKEITIRVRKKRENLVLQIKEPVEKNGALRGHNEYEKNILKVPYCITAGEMLELCGLDLPDVYLLDCLITTRLVRWWNSATQICLDENVYLGIIDYEVEIEYKDELESDIINQFAKWNILFDKDAVGKHSRFMKEYLKNKEKE